MVVKRDMAYLMRDASGCHWTCLSCDDSRCTWEFVGLVQTCWEIMVSEDQVEVFAGWGRNK